MKYLPRGVIVDVDGTIAIRGERSPYDWMKCGEDSANKVVVNLVRILHSQGLKIIICSGRDGICEKMTIDWLRVNKIPFDDFYIREAGNIEKDSVLKKRILDDHISKKYNIQFVLDDRDQVVRMWRDNGLICLQVADGNF